MLEKEQILERISVIQSVLQDDLLKGNYFYLKQDRKLLDK